MSAAPQTVLDTTEGQRLHAASPATWRRWGPYLSERQWGTVREDYSPGGTAWDSFPHDHARSRAYRWGEDGLGGFADEQMNWCLSVALWNGQDTILKERLFGLTNEQGNHGEDVKELYFFLDGTPTHSYMKMLYKYPHASFPYADLVDENRRRGPKQPEYEILDTGVFDDDAYFDVVIEYAKATPEDILMRVTVENRSPQPALLHVLPHFWARNTWSWDTTRAKAEMRRDGDSVIASNTELPHRYRWTVQPQADSATGAPPQWLFCENDTNIERLFGDEGEGPYKDGINDFLVEGKVDAVRRGPNAFGTKVASHWRIEMPGHGKRTIGMRLKRETNSFAPAQGFDEVFEQRIAEADAFYDALQSNVPDKDGKQIHRQALAGLIWSKQFYHFDVKRWLNGDASQPTPPESRRTGRNSDWRHLSNADIISMPDTWEYPWYASWDLAFQAVAFAVVDPDFAKKQLILLTQDRFMHPNGQLPAYEWAFGDANPPVHAWATWRVYEMDMKLTGRPDRLFLERTFHKLLLNFGWWVNRKDAEGHNLFQGGFLGLDNIQIFDRSAPLPTGGRIDQSDGTAWMAAYALDMMRIGLELATTNEAYVDISVKFFEHFLYISEAINGVGGGHISLWDEQDEFFYDALKLPDGESLPLRVRSIVGLSPLFAVHVLDASTVNKLPRLEERLRWFLRHRPDLAKLVSRWYEPGRGNTLLLSLLRGHRMKRLLVRMLDETEFLSDYGIRSLSRFHEHAPFALDHNGESFGIEYTPAESVTRTFGGNSNWRGPIWMPVNYLLVESLYEFHRYYGEDFRVEYPTGSGKMLSLREIANALAERLCRLFRQDATGKRPVMQAYPLLCVDPRAADLVLFHEYFHGDNGRGLGASHQSGWTSLVALLLEERPQKD
jgi:hypothetical protein